MPPSGGTLHRVPFSTREVKVAGPKDGNSVPGGGVPWGSLASRPIAKWPEARANLERLPAPSSGTCRIAPQRTVLLGLAGLRGLELANVILAKSLEWTPAKGSRLQRVEDGWQGTFTARRRRRRSPAQCVAAPPLLAFGPRSPRYPFRPAGQYGRRRHWPHYPPPSLSSSFES